MRARFTRRLARSSAAALACVALAPAAAPDRARAQSVQQDMDGPSSRTVDGDRGSAEDDPMADDRRVPVRPEPPRGAAAPTMPARQPGVAATVAPTAPGVTPTPLPTAPGASR